MTTRKSLSGALFAGLASMAMITPAFADNMQVTSTSGLNMRSGPGADHHVVTTLPSGALHVNWTCNTSKRGSTTWYEIDWNGHSGWAASHYLRYMHGSHRHCRGDTTYVPHVPVVVHTPVHSHRHVHRHRHGNVWHSHPHRHHAHRGHRHDHYGRDACSGLTLGGVRIRLCH